MNIKALDPILNYKHQSDTFNNIKIPLKEHKEHEDHEMYEEQEEIKEQNPPSLLFLTSNQNKGVVGKAKVNLKNIKEIKVKEEISNISNINNNSSNNNINNLNNTNNKVEEFSKQQSSEIKKNQNIVNSVLLSHLNNSGSINRKNIFANDLDEELSNTFRLRNKFNVEINPNKIENYNKEALNMNSHPKFRFYTVSEEKMNLKNLIRSNNKEDNPEIESRSKSLIKMIEKEKAFLRFKKLEHKLPKILEKVKLN